MGVNNRKTHPVQMRFGKNPDAIHLHAEIECIINHIRKHGEEDLYNSTMFIARSKQERISHECYVDVMAMAKPCEGCMKALKYYGIKNVIYTIDNDNYGVLKI